MTTSHVPQRVTEAMTTLAEMSIARVLCARDRDDGFIPLSAHAIPVSIFPAFARSFAEIVGALGWLLPHVVIVDPSTTPATSHVLAMLRMGAA